MCPRIEVSRVDRARLGVDWGDAKRIAAAHNAVLPLDRKTLPDLIGEALGRVKPVLDAHRAEYG